MTIGEQRGRGGNITELSPANLPSSQPPISQKSREYFHKKVIDFLTILHKNRHFLPILLFLLQNYKMVEFFS